MIATLVVWTLVVVATALIGLYPMIAALIVLAPLVGVVLAGIRGAEIGFGLLLLVAGGVWSLFWGVLALHYGLGLGVEQRYDGFIEFGVHLPSLAILGAITSLGLVVLILGVGFIFGVGPLAKREKGPEFDDESSSRRAIWVGTVEVILVMALLGVALLVVRSVFSYDPSECCSSVSNAPP